MKHLNRKKKTMTAFCAILILLEITYTPLAFAAQSQSRVRERIKKYQGEVEERIAYEYNKNGLVVRETHYHVSENGEEDLGIINEFEYYSNNSLKTERRIWGEWRIQEFHYDMYGHPMDCDMGIIDPSGVEVYCDMYGIPEIHRTYDSIGNLEQMEWEAQYDEYNSEVVKTVRIYEYDEQNRITRTNETVICLDSSVSLLEGFKKETNCCFTYRADGSYRVTIDVQSPNDEREIKTIDFQKNGFPAFLQEMQLTEEKNGVQQLIPADFYECFTYNEYENLTRIEIAWNDSSTTIEYQYTIDEGKVMYCMVHCHYIVEGDEESVNYATAYEYNENGEISREGFCTGPSWSYWDYSYIYESVEPPSIMPEDFVPYAPLYPWG